MVFWFGLNELNKVRPKEKEVCSWLPIENILLGKGFFSSNIIHLFKKICLHSDFDQIDHKNNVDVLFFLGRVELPKTQIIFFL